MKDPVLESYLKDFSTEYKKNHLPEATQFEHFVNYCIMSKRYTETFDPDDVAVGGTGDLGLDGIGIFVNDHLVQAESDIDYLKRTLRRLDVEFVFVQSKTSSPFDGGEIGTFIAGVRAFFDKVLPDNANAEIRQLHALKEYIYSFTIDMDAPPACQMYYATTGRWRGEPALIARARRGEEDLKGTGLVNSANFIAVDAERLKSMHREINNKFVRELTFEKHAILPDIAGVTESYIGVVPAKEYLNILCDDDGILNKRLFYDNVRDFQGHNAVNSEIRSTIVESSEQDRFSLLNNGVTIVAKDISKVGAKFRLRDYQVVNGCQTSHVIYLAKDHFSDKVFLPIKLIVTSDLDVTNQIIQGANRQTEIKPEAFESLQPFQKELEETYLAVGKSLLESIFYERRSKQYEDMAVSRDHVITLPAQISCFVGMFLNEPHSTHRYYGELLDAYRSRIFNEAHRLMPYVTSGVALAALERLFNEELLPRSLRRSRFQLLMAFRLRFGRGRMPALNAKNMDEYCAYLLGIVNNKVAYVDAIKEVAELTERVRDSAAPWREPPERTRSFTNGIIAALSGDEIQEPARAARIDGTVYQFSPVKGYGFIRSSEVTSRVYFSAQESDVSVFQNLKLPAQASFILIEGVRGLRAIDVQLLPVAGRQTDADEAV